jgi:hypothetical protein
LAQLHTRSSIPLDFSALSRAAQIRAKEKVLLGTAELRAVIALLPDLPDWGRAVVLHLTVPGRCYGTCKSCGEWLDVEWNGSWTLAGQSVQRLAPPAPSVETIERIVKVAIEHQASNLVDMDSLVGSVQCPKCGVSCFSLAALAYPLSVPS